MRKGLRAGRIRVWQVLISGMDVHNVGKQCISTDTQEMQASNDTNDPEISQEIK